MKLYITLIFSMLFLYSYGQVVINEKNYSDVDSITKMRIDSIMYSRFPYNEEIALKDIRKNNIRILYLYGTNDPYDDLFDTKLIEDRFGFKYHFEEFLFPETLLQKIQDRYNSVVYSYLDSIYRIDVKSEIDYEIKRQFWEESITAKQSNKDLRKKIRTELKGENGQIKKALYEIDKQYRDRNFEQALEKYKTFNFENIQPKTKNYILNSQYHCLMNLHEYNEAQKLYENNKNEINKLIK
ncbi:hypothetical protein ACE1ET_06195 [Saccharicrinis sp. FJH62]|uniref:hypothetical protein n=1 Tax=Saccharicrinis sp. FJH62 TaxID=3344657 RepID=UPI0035D4CBB6